MSEVQQFIFKPLQSEHLELLCQWLDQPHVKEWWDDHLTHDEIKAKYGARIGDTVVVPFIVYLSEKPIGFIQYYVANQVGEGWWPDAEEGTVGIDQFIGEAEYLNQGYGTALIRAFVKKLLADPKIKKVITEADPDNARARRCYEKAGFHFVGEIDTPDGKSLLLEIGASVEASK